MKSSEIPQIFCIFWTQIVFVWSQWIYDACDVYAILRGARGRQTKAATERIITALQALHNNNNNKMHPACSGNQLYYYSIDVIKMLDSDRANFGVTRGCHWRYSTCGHLSMRQQWFVWSIQIHTFLVEYYWLIARPKGTTHEHETNDRLEL